MSAGVQENDIAFFSLLEESNEFVDFDFLGCGVIVGIVLELQAAALDDAFMVGPGRGRDEDSGRQLLFDELEADSQSSCA